MRSDFLSQILDASDESRIQLSGQALILVVPRQKRAHCEFEQESTVEKYALQHGLVCPSCFDSVMGFDQESGRLVEGCLTSEELV